MYPKTLVVCPQTLGKSSVGIEEQPIDGMLSDECYSTKAAGTKRGNTTGTKAED